MAEVRSSNGIPTASAFGGVGAPSPGTPIVVDVTTGKAYVLNSAGAVVTAGAVPIDVFLIGGQSNAIGQIVTPNLAPTVEAGSTYQYTSSALSEVTNAVGFAAEFPQQNSSGPWPAYARAYYAGTGRKICFVPVAYDGSAQVAAYTTTGTYNWDDAGGGTLFDSAVTNTNAAMAALVLAGYDPTLRGILWCQGETDALHASFDAATYLSTFQTMIAAFRTSFSNAYLPFYIFRTGTHYGYSDTNFALVRAKQDYVPTVDPYCIEVFTDAIDFAYRNPAWMSDEYHYTQPAYNEMGSIGAFNVMRATIGV